MTSKLWLPEDPSDRPLQTTGPADSSIYNASFTSLADILEVMDKFTKSRDASPPLDDIVLTTSQWERLRKHAQTREHQPNAFGWVDRPLGAIEVHVADGIERIRLMMELREQGRYVGFVMDSVKGDESCG